MASTSWGAPTLVFVPLVAGQDPAAGEWTGSGVVKIESDVIAEGATTLTTEEGETKTLKNAKGNNVDSRKMPSSYSLETKVLRIKTETQPFTATNGIVQGEFAMRLIPEDPTSIGIQFDRCGISVNKEWDEENGLCDVITVSALMPYGTDKEICKEYIAKTTEA